MPGFRDIDTKLASLRNMRRVTKTMKMVSATKLYRSQDARRRTDQYMRALQAIVGRVASSASASSHPLLQPRPAVRNVLLLLITADKGLCGSFNLNLLKQVNAWLNDHKTNLKNLRFSFCGQQGLKFFKSKVEIRNQYEGVINHPHFSDALKIGQDILSVFLERKYEEVYIAYNINHSPLSQSPCIEQILPFDFSKLKARTSGPRSDYLFEPDETALLGAILEKLIYNRIFHALLENAAGEHGARMTSMDSATSNIDALYKFNTLLRNRARQGAITRELVEIVSGTEALK